MECKLIEAAAFEELKAIVNRIQIRTTHLATKTMPRKPGGWLTQEEVCGMLRVSKRVLQYYRRQRKIPYSMIGNKVYFRESDIQLGVGADFVNGEQNGRFRALGGGCGRGVGFVRFHGVMILRLF